MVGPHVSNTVAGGDFDRMTGKRVVQLLKASNFLEVVVAREMNKAGCVVDVAAGPDAAIADVVGLM
jgi:hypothetical protein